MVEQVRKLGPLGIPGKFQTWDQEMNNFTEDITVREAAACSCNGLGPHVPTSEKVEAPHV
jgi:hypothetical protein